MRRVIFLAVLMVLAAVSSVYADASLYKGTGSIGSVQTIENASGYYVSAEDVGRLFGFTSSRSGEELLLSRGSSQLRLMTNSAAAWKGFSILPLYSAPFERDGKIWLDAQSAASLFQSFAGSGSNNRLHFSKNVGSPVQKAVQASITPAPVVKPESTQQVSAPVKTSQPVVQVASTPVLQSPAPKLSETPKTSQPVVQTASVPVTQTPAPKLSDTPKPSQPCSSDSDSSS